MTYVDQAEARARQQARWDAEDREKLRRRARLKWFLGLPERQRMLVVSFRYAATNTVYGGAASEARRLDVPYEVPKLDNAKVTSASRLLTCWTVGKPQVFK